MLKNQSDVSRRCRAPSLYRWIFVCVYLFWVLLCFPLSAFHWRRFCTALGFIKSLRLLQGVKIWLWFRLTVLSDWCIYWPVGDWKEPLPRGNSGSYLCSHHYVRWIKSLIIWQKAGQDMATPSFITVFNTSRHTTRFVYKCMMSRDVKVAQYDSLSLTLARHIIFLY